MEFDTSNESVKFVYSYTKVETTNILEVLQVRDIHAPTHMTMNTLAHKSILRTKQILMRGEGLKGTEAWLYILGDAQTESEVVSLSVPRNNNSDMAKYSATFTES